MILYFLKLGHIIFDVLFYFFSVSSEKSLGFRLRHKSLLVFFNVFLF